MLRCSRCGGKLGLIEVGNINNLLDLQGASEAGVTLKIVIEPNDSPVFNIIHEEITSEDYKSNYPYRRSPISTTNHRELNERMDKQFYNWLRKKKGYGETYCKNVAKNLIKTPEQRTDTDKANLNRVKELYEEYLSYKRSLNEPVDLQYINKMVKEEFDSLRKTIK